MTGIVRAIGGDSFDIDAVDADALPFAQHLGPLDDTSHRFVTHQFCLGVTDLIHIGRRAMIVVIMTDQDKAWRSLSRDNAPRRDLYLDIAVNGETAMALPGDAFDHPWSSEFMRLRLGLDSCVGRKYQLLTL